MPRVSCATPAFATQYVTLCRGEMLLITKELMEPMLMMLPLPAASMHAATRLPTKNMLERFVSTILRHSSSETSLSATPSEGLAALFTRMSIRPNLRITSSTKESSCSPEVTSARA